MSENLHHATVQSEGVVTHVLVPIDEYERLIGRAVPKVTPPSARQIDDAIAIWNNQSMTWHDGENVFQNMLRDGIEHVRRACGISQGELGRKIGLSQPQMSRVENRPERATLGVLKRIAEALSQASSENAEKSGGSLSRKTRRAVQE